MSGLICLSLFNHIRKGTSRSFSPNPYRTKRVVVTKLESKEKSRGSQSCDSRRERYRPTYYYNLGRRTNTKSQILDSHCFVVGGRNQDVNTERTGIRSLLIRRTLIFWFTVIKMLGTSRRSGVYKGAWILKVEKVRASKMVKLL